MFEDVLAKALGAGIVAALIFGLAWLKREHGRSSRNPLYTAAQRLTIEAKAPADGQLTDADIVLLAILTKLKSQKETSWSEVKDAVRATGQRMNWNKVHTLIDEAIAEGLIVRKSPFLGLGTENYSLGDGQKTKS